MIDIVLMQTQCDTYETMSVLLNPHNSDVARNNLLGWLTSCVDKSM